MRKASKNEKGITLIALVVTIVVLLILAGVSISMLTGENGIITQAQEAKLVTERSSLKEQLQLDAVAEADKDSLEVFKSLGYVVGENNQVKAEAIPNLQLTTGRGTNGKDIYIIEMQGDRYQLIYIDKNGDRIEVGEVGQVGEDNPFSYTQADIDETLKYFKWRIEEVTEELKEEKGYSDDMLGKKVAIIYDTVKSYYRLHEGEVFPIKKIVIPNTIEDSDFVDIEYSFEGIANVDTIIYLNDYGMFRNYEAANSVKNIKIAKYGKIDEIYSTSSFYNYYFDSIMIDKNSPYYTAVNDVIFSKDMTELCFYPREKNDTIYIIPNGVTSIRERAFYDCSSLINIIIPESVTSIRESAFLGCSSLTNITIPDSVTNIGTYVFSNCSNLTNITIPDSVTNIETYVFSNCSNLTNITIPESVTSIENSAFYNCSNLTTVNYRGTQEQWNEITIGYDNSYFKNATINYNYTGE